MQFTNQERAFNKSADSITKTLVKQNAYKTGYNSTFALGWVTCSKDSFVPQNQPLRQAAKRYS